jgi:hypothetical protein
MKRLLAILMLAATALFAACTDPAGTPGDPGPIQTDPMQTEMPVEPTLAP